MNMRTRRSWILRVRDLFHRERLERVLNDELVSHLELHIADNRRMQLSHENDSSLRQFVLQGYVSAGEVISGKLRLFDKNISSSSQPETSTR
jgi:hypothetical protein